MKDLVSIIIPVYNVEKYLKKCVDSILNQTYTNLEVVLVDDGSTDASGQICDMYAGMDLRVRVIHKANGGLSDARNAGMKIATGEYIGFVDSDDWIEPDMYECLYNLAMENSLDVVAGRFCETIDGVDVNCECTGEFRIFTGEEMLEINISGHPQYVVTNSVWDRLYRRDILEGMKFPVGRKYEDIVFSTEVFLKAKRCGYLDSKVYHYTIREDSIMGRGLKCKKGISKDVFVDLLPQMRDKTRILYEAGCQELGDESTYSYLRECLNLLGRYCGESERKVDILWLQEEYQKNRRWMKRYVSKHIKRKRELSVVIANVSVRLFVALKKMEKFVHGNKV